MAVAVYKPPSNAASIQTLRERAEALVPYLRENEAQTEKLGRIPDGIMEKLRQAEFFKILQPADFGGYEYPPKEALGIATILARGSTSTAWVAALLMIHSWEVALVSSSLAEDIWGNDHGALISSSYAPFGSARKVDDGYIVNGSWAWSSGCDHCQWVTVGCVFPADNSFGVVQKAMFIPKSDYEIDPNSWQMAGMQGTGSRTVTVKEAFVPDHRVHNMMNSFDGVDTGRTDFSSDTYKFPFGTLFAWALAAVCIGAAEGAVSVYADMMRRKNHAYDGRAMKFDPYAQLKLGEAAAQVSAAAALMWSDFNKMSRIIHANRAVEKSERMAYKSNAAYAAKTSFEAIAKITKAAGGSAFATSHPLQRIYRDISAASNHAHINPDKAAANLGLYLMSGQLGDFAI